MYDVEQIRKDFPMIENNEDIIYFDNSATSFKPRTVIDVIKNYYEKLNTNIHRGDYDLSYKVSTLYDDARNTVREFINASDKKEIVFTSGDTASLNSIVYGYCYSHIDKDDVILTTLAEHASSILPLFRLAKDKGCKIEYIPLNEDGTFNLNEYENCFKKHPNIKFVCLTYVSNVLGYIYPIKDICRIAHEYNALVSVDAAQAVPHFKVDVEELGVDFLSFSSHKMCGPSGVGVMYGKYKLLEETEPLLLGGGANARFEKDGSLLLMNAPEKFEAGTPNIEGVLGLDAACNYLMNIGMDNIHKHDKELVTYFVEKISKLDNIILYNPLSDCGIVSFNVKGIFAQDVGTYLNKNGICVRTGNHCAKILHNVIEATETIRASVYLYNSKEEIDKFIEVIKDVTLEKCIGAVI